MAKRFQFRLETLRKLRRQRQDDCRRLVAGRLRQISGVRGQIDGLNDEFGLQVAAMRNLASAGNEAGRAGVGAPPVWTVDVAAVRRHRAYANHLRVTIAAAHKQLAGLEVELAKEQAVLAEATKAVKVLDKLEERQRGRYELALTRAETAENDEIALQYARRNAPAAVVGATLADECP